METFSYRRYSPIPQQAARTGQQIRLSQPPALPAFMERNVTLIQRLTGPSNADLAKASAVAQNVLSDIGAGAGSIAGMLQHLSARSVCEMFCGDNPPVRYGRNEMGQVAFEIQGDVDVDKLEAMARGLSTIGMPVQAQALRDSLRTGAALDDEAVALQTYAVRVVHGMVRVGLPDR